MKMEHTECTETSAYKIQTPGNYPEEKAYNKYMAVATRYMTMIPNFFGLVFDAVDLPCSIFIKSGVN
jgi:hypothetical protein